jgi:hypothetical protein
MERKKSAATGGYSRKGLSGAAITAARRGIVSSRSINMKTREQEIIELTQALKALGYNIEALKIGYCGEIDNPQHLEIALELIRFRDTTPD